MSVTTVNTAEPARAGSTHFPEEFHINTFMAEPAATVDELDSLDVPGISLSVVEAHSNGTSWREDAPTSIGFGDDALVYANLAEIARHNETEDIDRRPSPPFPDATDEPVRVLHSGWKEYKTMGGRSYYFHPNGICQWKPPRHKKDFALGTTSFSSSTTSTTTTTGCCDDSIVIPIPHSHHQNEYDTAGCSDIISQSGGGAAPPPGMVIPPKEWESGGGINRNAPTTKQSMEQSVINALAHNRLSAVPIRQGQLEKCKLADNGVKAKKKEWVNSYAYLYPGHLLFYKNEKSSIKAGKQYPAPTDVCDLRGALLCYADADKARDKRRKHLISLTLHSKTEYLFSCCGTGTGSEADINGWFHSLRQTISQLPPITHTYPRPAAIASDFYSSLQRSTPISASTRNTKTGGGSGNKSSIHQSVKSPSGKARSFGGSSGGGGGLPPGDRALFSQADQNPTRDSIIERLLRFFRSRPSIDHLRERGIYKPEPIFGSTLSAICAHDKAVVPKFISEVTHLIEEKGLDSDGLYRVNGNLSSVQKLRCQIDQDKYEALLLIEDVHVLTGALKLFFRELSEPIFPHSMNKEFMSAIREPNARQRFKSIDELLTRLPLVNRETLKVLIRHLEKVSTHSKKNRMQIHNLAIVFGPSLFCSEDRPAAVRKSSSQDKGKRKAGASMDNSNTPTPTSEPNHNLAAYRMIISGQIIEYILNQSSSLSVFQ